MIRVQREDFDVGRELDRLAAGDHSIGGVAKRATTADVRGFAAAARAENVAGASLYDAGSTTPGMWRLLRRAVSRCVPLEQVADTRTTPRTPPALRTCAWRPNVFGAGW